ncbi:uncharacterized protein PRCAT00006018001 [Priceomyces carsonii]|uniref:uncharacterized protein n=1 Tax=Priceomyces carsonii TaxID=28549 RepID=UPI002EDAE875|nr:unnamed protein product [Priceomyces carsonii]
MSVVTSNERQFVSTYLELINLSQEVDPSKFYSSADYYKIDSLGPTLPQMNVNLPKAKQLIDTKSMITLKFVSIKPPYKFISQLTEVPLSSTVYSVKKSLIADQLKNEEITPSNIKLLLKGKVIQDTSLLSSLPVTDDEMAFKVMISAPVPSASTPKSTTPESEDPDVSEPITILDITWNKIYEILKSDLGSDLKASDALSKLKANWAK